MKWKSIGRIDKPFNPFPPWIMLSNSKDVFRFQSYVLSGLSNVQFCSCSIEPRTNLLVIEQRKSTELYPRYIRLTAQQVKRIKLLFFKGNFFSSTKPSNCFTLEDDVVTMCCRSENQVIRLRLSEMHNIYSYLEKNMKRIAKYDIQFRR